ncbi:MAG: 4a-hydroxytetrahydrobiopterin dehydratase [Xanthomonadales bacterium]|nr:4a-hydroxytetrahydrobiopterin dehydratase [Xanthomonadales bacterium]
MSDLTRKTCTPCEGGTEPLRQDQIELLLPQIPQWKLEGIRIVREFRFDNFHETMAFINAMAWIAHQEDHHPDFDAGYHHCRLTFTTHAIGGLSENDFICAAKIDRLISA